MRGARELAVSLLCETEEKKSYSNIALDKALKTSDLGSADKKLAAALYLGVIERKISLDYIISRYVKKKTDPVIRQILRISIYQLKYMDSIPDRAAVNEGVKLAAVFRKKSAAGFINAVLRSFIRDKKEVALPQGRREALSVKYSIPFKLLSQLVEDYGEEKIIPFLEDSLGEAPLMIRRNRKLVSKADFEAALGERAEEHGKIEDCYYYRGGAVTEDEAFRKGWFHVQDAASQLCCKAVGAEGSEEVILDVCSAPGGKAFTIAQSMKETAVLYAFDLYEQRADLIKEGAARLSLENIRAMAADASDLPEEVPMADKILCDVPCSGYGVIRKKPEIKYKDIDENKDLPPLQYKILCQAAKKLKKGGTVVYSTCTLSKAENEDNVEKFLAEHRDFEAVDALPEYFPGRKFVTLFPEDFGSDGFFIAKLVKKG